MTYSCYDTGSFLEHFNGLHNEESEPMSVVTSFIPSIVHHGVIAFHYFITTEQNDASLEAGAQHTAVSARLDTETSFSIKMSVCPELLITAGFFFQSA